MNLHYPLRSLPESGFAIIDDVFAGGEVAELIGALGAEQLFDSGIRNLMEHEAVHALCHEGRIIDLVSESLGERAFAVRAILFDKSAEANWTLPMHQDTKIAVKERREVEGYSSWSVKDGVLHVMPPARVLERQIALRIHLDDCGRDSGPVEVIPSSHREGRLDRESVARWTGSKETVACTGGIGSVLIFRSLLLHGSKKAVAPVRRRVLHIEFADCDLDAGLEWRWRVPLSSTAALT